MKSTTFIPFLALAHTALASTYNLAKDYSGSSFFSTWDFYGAYDNLTNGDVTWVDAATASSSKLAYVNSAGHAILRVDNTSNVVYNEKRNSVRIESKEAYPVGSVWVVDIEHLPYGCSVWPAFWTAGTAWPGNGEIDIIEGVNLGTQNQMALHTSTGCTKPAGASTQSGADGPSGDCGTTSGCTVTDASTASFGAGFASGGGGVWATEFAAGGITIWFWPRAKVPSAVSASADTVDPSAWGTPSAYFPSSSCAISNFFGPQKLIFDITLCGDWAGAAAVYNASSCYSTTSPKQGLCYVDNVINAGSPQYDNAYFDISYLRTYTLPNVTLVTNATGSASAGASATKSAGSAGASGTGSSSSARGLSALGAGAGAVVAAAIAAVVL